MQISVEFSAPLLGPTSISFGPEFAQSGFIGPAGNDAEFTRLTVRAALCPFGLTLLRGVHVHPCVLIDAGTMTAEGRSEAVPVPESIDEAWFATGPGLRFRARPHSSLTLEFLAGAPLAWTQPVYVFTEPRKVVYPVPLLGWTAQIALGLSFGDQL
jgi:hypothetical protein